MEKATAISIAKSLFEQHTVNDFYIAKDGQGFFSETSANNHQQSFKTDEPVIHVTRAEAESYKPSDVPAPEATDDVQLTDEEKEAALAEAANNELSDADKAAALNAAKKKKASKK